MTDEPFFEIDIDQAEARIPVTILRCYGSFDSGSSSVFDPIASGVIDQGAENILIDLRGISLLTSVGIQKITWLFDKLHPEASGDGKVRIMAGIRAGTYIAPHLKLIRPPKDQYKVLKLTGLDMFIASFKNEKKALKAF